MYYKHIHTLWWQHKLQTQKKNTLSSSASCLAMHFWWQPALKATEIRNAWLGSPVSSLPYFFFFFQCSHFCFLCKHTERWTGGLSWDERGNSKQENGGSKRGAEKSTAEGSYVGHFLSSVNCSFQSLLQCLPFIIPSQHARVGSQLEIGAANQFYFRVAKTHRDWARNTCSPCTIATTVITAAGAFMLGWLCCECAYICVY